MAATIIQKLKHLSPDLQADVLKYVENLLKKGKKVRPKSKSNAVLAKELEEKYITYNIW